MNNIESTIANLRIERNLSQAELAAGILSKAQLSKAEHGLTDLTVTKVVGLLSRLHISAREFFSLAETATPDEQVEQQLLVAITKAVLTMNPTQANLIVQQAMTHYQQQQTQFSRLTLIMVRALTAQLTDQDLGSDDVNYLLQYLFSVEHWSRYELVLFGNTSSALPLASANTLARELVKRSSQYQALNFDLLVNLLCNAVFTNLEQGQQVAADYFVRALTDLDFTTYACADEYLLKTYTSALYEYKYGQRATAKKTIESLLQTLDLLQMRDLRHLFENNYHELLAAEPS